MGAEHCKGFTPLVAELAIKLNNSTAREAILRTEMARGHQKIAYCPSLEPGIYIMVNTREALRCVRKVSDSLLEDLTDLEEYDLGTQIIRKNLSQP